MRYRAMLTTLLALGCLSHQKDEALQRVDRSLRERLGELADPQVAFMRDSTHLLIQLATVAFRTVTDDELTDRAKNISSFTYARYDRANEVDSVTVFYREKVRRGVWHIRHIRSFGVADLGDSTVTVTPGIDWMPD